MVCASEGVHPKDFYKLTSIKTMSYSHTLQEVKFSLVLQRIFGNQNPSYDADHVRTNDALNRNYRTPQTTDTLSIPSNNPVAAEAYSFNMQTGRFLELADGNKNYMKLDGFENFVAPTSNAQMNITGTEGANRIVTGSNDDYVQGKGGSDRIFGNHGHDTLLGGSGHDVISGGSGNDHLAGGSGFDRLYGGRDADSFRLTGGWGFDRIMDFQDGQDKIEIKAIDGLDNVHIQDGRDGHARIWNNNDLIAIVNNTQRADLTIQGEVIM